MVSNADVVLTQATIARLLESLATALCGGPTRNEGGASGVFHLDDGTRLAAGTEHDVTAPLGVARLPFPGHEDSNQTGLAQRAHGAAMEV